MPPTHPQGIDGIIAEFNAVAPHYESNRLAPWYQAQADLLIEATRHHAASRILDVGCGTGYFLRSFCANHPAARGTGIDLAPGMIAEAQRRAACLPAGQVRFLTGDFTTMDPGEIPEAPFPLVTCTSAFHYFPDPHAAAARFAALTAPGGEVWIIERLLSGSPLTAIWGWLHRRVIRDNVRFYTVKELADSFSIHCFESPLLYKKVYKFLWKGKLYTSLAALRFTRRADICSG